MIYIYEEINVGKEHKGGGGIDRMILLRGSDTPVNLYTSIFLDTKKGSLR